MFGSIIAALALLGLAGGAGVAQAFINRSAEREKNETNLKLQQMDNQLQMQMTQATNDAMIQRDREANETTRYLAENAHQIEMADLQKAGLNPILAAGGQGASVPTQVVSPLSTPNTKAGKVTSESLDFSGVTNMLQSLATVMLVSNSINSAKIANAKADKAWFKQFSKGIENL